MTMNNLCENILSIIADYAAAYVFIDLVKNNFDKIKKFHYIYPDRHVCL